jgi:hypothetical protein
MSLVHPINRDPSILGEVGQAHLAARILFLQIEIEIGIERGRASEIRGVCSANCAGSSGMKLFPGGRRFWRAASGAKQHVSLDGNKSSSRTCILIQERTRKENPGGKRQSERGRERERRKRETSRNREEALQTTAV